MALPIIVTFLSQIIVFHNELSKFRVSLQSAEQLDESLRGYIVSFDLQRFNSPMLLKKESQLSSALITHKTVINYNPRLVSKRLK